METLYAQPSEYRIHLVIPGDVPTLFQWQLRALLLSLSHLHRYFHALPVSFIIIHLLPTGSNAGRRCSGGGSGIVDLSKLSLSTHSTPSSC
jgi:hypothetical protein